MRRRERGEGGGRELEGVSFAAQCVILAANAEWNYALSLSLLSPPVIECRGEKRSCEVL